MRGDPSPLLHALTPLAKGRKGVRVFSRPTLLDNALWVPYGTSAADLRTTSFLTVVTRGMGDVSRDVATREVTDVTDGVKGMSGEDAPCCMVARS